MVNTRASGSGEGSRLPLTSPPGSHDGQPELPPPPPLQSDVAHLVAEIREQRRQTERLIEAWITDRQQPQQNQFHQEGPRATTYSDFLGTRPPVFTQAKTP